MFGIRSVFTLALTSLVIASPLARQRVPVPNEYLVGFHYPDSTTSFGPRNVTALIDKIAEDVNDQLSQLSRRDGTALEILDRYDLGDGYYQGFAFKSASPAAQAAIQEHPDVAYIIQNEYLPPPPTVPTAVFPDVTRNDTVGALARRDSVWVGDNLWNLDDLDGTRNNWYNHHSSAGKPVDVYVVDNGVDVNHPEFEGRATWGYPGTSGQGQFHGTHVAGIVAGKSVGVARKAFIISVKIGETLNDVMGALRWVLEDVKKRQGTQIANFSWGFYEQYQPVLDATKALIDRNVAIATAAGNEGKESCLSSPGGKLSGLINVAASTKDNKLPSYSDRGGCVHIIAPGDDILSANIGGGFATASGTSMSAPHVAGALAMAISSGKAWSGPSAIDAVLKAGKWNKIQNLPGGTRNLFLQLP
ncbi:peptidase S8/S53 domain-containing protein [Phlyctochytrium arcticum]|nr:peptidase S8/S53 domain-containing protein [Phlyctochytrium arcticum]